MHCHGNCHSLRMFEMFMCHLEMQAQRITPKLAMWVSVNPSIPFLCLIEKADLLIFSIKISVLHLSIVINVVINFLHFDLLSLEPLG